MSFGFTSGNPPGFTTAKESIEEQIWWTGRNHQTQLSSQEITLASINVDAGNTPTTTIRGGHVVARETVSGNHYLYNADANDGTQFATGILEHTKDMLKDAIASHQFMEQLSSGLYRSTELIVTGGTKGDIDLQVQAQLIRQGWMPDGNGPDGAAFLDHPMGEERVAGTTITLDSDDNGKRFLALAALNATLPANNAANVGFKAEFFQTTDNALVLTSAAGDDIIHIGNLAADTVTCSTGGQQIGSWLTAELRYIATGVRRWFVGNKGGTTSVAAG